MKFLRNLKLAYRDVSGKNGREYLIVGWIILLIGVFIIAFIFKITSIVCAYKIGLIVMTILVVFVVFVIAPIFVFSLYKEYKKECKEIESGEKNE